MSRNSFYIGMSLYFLVAGIMICFFQGTGDAGDSINHFLISKFSWQHPYLFFDHWGKPLFTLLSSPFSQLGFNGIKIFNVLMTGLAVGFTWRVAQQFFPSVARLTAILYLFAPLPFVLTFSGLTEPLFAAILAIALYLIVIKEANYSAAILISFLPFVRSEGLILVGVWAIYFLIKKYWKCLGLLGIGHLVYSLSGWWIHQDLLWVFKEITYAQIEPAYGSGTLSHFVIQLIYILGIPIYSIFCVGLLVSLSQVFRLKKRAKQLEQTILILGGFVAFFVAHSFFWYLGIFKSMGLNRVFVAIMPLIVLVSVQGVNCLNVNVLNRFIKSFKIRLGFKYLLIIYVIVFPFTSNPAAIKWSEDLELLPEQKLIEETIVPYLQQYKNTDAVIYYYAHPYLSKALDIDPFNQNQYRPLDQFQLPYLSSDALIIWDNWFASIDNRVEEKNLQQRKDLNLLQVFETQGKRNIRFVIYQKKDK